MNLILTSATLVGSNIGNYVQEVSKQPLHHFTINDVKLGAYNVGSSDAQARWYLTNNRYSICTTSEKKYYDDAFYSAQHYTFEEGSDIEDTCVAFNEVQSCVVLDADTNAVWLSSDSIGSTPIWYAISDSNIMITTDLLLAYHAGFAEPTALGPGQNMLIDLNSKEIVDMHTRRIHPCNHKVKAVATEIPELCARKVFQGGVESIKSVCNVPRDIIYSHYYTIERDTMDSSSLLLDCVLDALAVDRAVRVSRPLVTDSIQIEHPSFNAVMDNISRNFLTMPLAHVREPSFRSMAIERWNLCQAASAQDSRTLLSHDTGMNPRPVAVYLQNLFCALLNVTIIYPFRSKVFQEAIWDTKYPKSYLHEAVELLRSPRLISGTGASDRGTSVYMRAACDIPSHGSRTWDASDLQGCTGAGCADRLIVHTPAIAATTTVHADHIADSVNAQKTEHRHTSTIDASGAHKLDGKDGTTSPEMRYVPNSLLNILSSVQPHATAEGIIVLLLVTKGYADMLTNFLCSAHRIHFAHFLILTHDAEIQEIAAQFGVGFYFPHPSFQEVPTDADFGSVQYQSLVFSRTELAMELLLSGYQPIIADVDTVWLSNPLKHLPWYHLTEPISSSTSTAGGAPVGQQTPGQAPDGVSYDLAITDDNGEVCGCFIALRGTDHAVSFWNEVYTAHRQLIVDALRNGNFKAFDESEQKIVTQLIYGRQYKATLAVLKLPGEMFPSGYAYFNTQTHRVQGQQPAVVHNNFIVGRALKKARFQRYGMWSTLKSAPDRASPADLCESDATTNTYARFFTSVSRNISIPSLNMYLPVHGSEVSDLNSVMVHVSAEGPVRVRLNGATADFTFPPSKVYVDNNPPSYMDASPAVFAVLNLSANVNNSVMTFTVVTQSESVALSADVAFYRESFAIDRAGRFQDLATEVVLRDQRKLRESAFASAPAPTPALQVPTAGSIGIDSAAESSTPPTKEQPDEPAADELDAPPATSNTTTHVPVMSYTIRIITCKRPASLHRLLTSLASAEYLGYNNISLYISVDMPRSLDVKDQNAAEAVRQIASAFEWKHGPKEVKVHASNQGLVDQWYHIWQPRSPFQAAFIFEDDMEVSPYFFVWAVRAADKYYLADPDQMQRQWQLLSAVRAMKTHRAGPTAGAGGNTAAAGLTPLEECIKSTAGKPLIYGICLQKQHLDPNHYPRKLTIMNGFRPFLYSLVGSWGPLMLPYAWQAFREWWAWRQLQPPHSAAPQTANLVTNYFLSQNPSIWTPWHVRFAYETGAKCLYPNLPGEHALVVNHREPGENYATASGPDGSLLNAAFLHTLGLLPVPRAPQPTALETSPPSPTTEPPASQALAVDRLKQLGDYVLPARPSDTDVLKWSLLHLPLMSTLAAFQYDFNLRRAGALGLDHAHSLKAASTNDERHELSTAWRGVKRAMALHAALRSSANHKQSHVELNKEHWVYIIDVIERAILPGARILHFSYTPLVALLPDPRNSYTQALVLDGLHLPMHVWEDALQQSDYDSKIAYFLHNTRLLSQPTREMAIEGEYSMAVIDTRVAGGETVALGEWLQQLWAALVPVEYLLVIGPCSAAPTDLAVNYGCGDTVTVVKYAMVEDMCAIGGAEDIGAVLFRDVRRMTSPADRFALSVRIAAGSLQSRHVVSPRGLV